MCVFESLLAFAVCYLLHCCCDDDNDADDDDIGGDALLPLAMELSFPAEGCGCGWSFGRSYRVGRGAGGSVGSNRETSFAT